MQVLNMLSESTKSSLTYLTTTTLGVVFSGLASKYIADRITARERMELETLTKQFKARIDSDPRLKVQYGQILNLLRDINEIGNSSSLANVKAKKKSDLIKLTNKFLSNLSNEDKRTYFKLQLLSDKISGIKTRTTVASMGIGGIIGFLMANNSVNNNEN